MIHTNKKPPIKLGSIVSLKSHPYKSSNQNVKIIAYAQFTPPLMVVIGCKKATKYNTETGELENNSILTVYYNSKKGKHEENWFKETELEFISDPKTGSEDLSEKSLSALKNKWVGKQAIVTSVDLELGKLQIYKDSELNGKTLLDFLPPLGTIINVSEEKQYQTFNDKNGEIILEKARYMGKLRYYNNFSHKMSEEYVALSALKLVLGNEGLPSLKKGELYKYPDLNGLLNNKELNLKRIPVKFLDVIFKHYYYEYRFENIFNGKIISLSQEDVGAVLDNWLRICKLNTLYEDGFSSLDALNSKTTDEKCWLKKWFCIKYLDKKGKSTTRVIYVCEVNSYKDFYGRDRSFIKALCLLRNGAERHFNFENIVAIKEVDISECIKD